MYMLLCDAIPFRRAAMRVTRTGVFFQCGLQIGQSSGWCVVGILFRYVTGPKARRHEGESALGHRPMDGGIPNAPSILEREHRRVRGRHDAGGSLRIDETADRHVALPRGGAR